MRVKIIFNGSKEWTKGVAESIEDKLAKSGYEIVDKNADVTITVGGDGTVFYNLDKLEGKILPIGTEKSGFCIPFTRALEKLEELMHSKPIRLIVLEAYTGNKMIGKAINDIVFHTVDYRLHEFSFVSKGKSYVFKGDGLVLATPLGSSSYNRSVGGPVVDRDLNVMSVSAIAPYTQFYPKVVAANEEYTVKSDSKMAVIFDGWKVIELDKPVSVTAKEKIDMLIPKRCKF